MHSVYVIRSNSEAECGFVSVAWGLKFPYLPMQLQYWPKGSTE